MENRRLVDPKFDLIMLELTHIKESNSRTEKQLDDFINEQKSVNAIVVDNKIKIGIIWKVVMSAFVGTIMAITGAMIAIFRPR